MLRSVEVDGFDCCRCSGDARSYIEKQDKMMVGLNGIAFPGIQSSLGTLNLFVYLDL